MHSHLKLFNFFFCKYLRYDGIEKNNCKENFSLGLEYLENGIIRILFILFACWGIIPIDIITSSVYRRSVVHTGCLNTCCEYLGLIILLKLARQKDEM